jgi:sugar (pentulose or hexulose) kinase
MSTFLGIEFGSTRIKAVLIDENFKPIASGSHDWENRLVDGVWTYDLDDVWTGLRDSFHKLNDEVKSRTGQPLTHVDAIGISAMMHGYLAFDEDGELLVPFRTWRNTTTGKAADELTALFGFNIPQRWSVAHLRQAILNKEPHVKDIALITTLAGYVHWKLTDRKVLGVGDASGVFSIDSATNDYNTRMVRQFDELISGADDSLQIKWKLTDILPSVLNAGEDAGSLTEAGALLLDPSGVLKAGVPFCPPEGDAGTGMVATNSIAARTGNVSAGTSIFAMIVLEKALSKVYPEIDMVTTPSGKPVAMVHCNNCTTDLDAWIKLFGEALALSGAKPEKEVLYDALYYKALEGDADCGGLISYNYYAGEPTVHIAEGRPLFVRPPDAHFTLANFIRNLLYSSMATLKLGMDILTEKEKARVDRLLGHGGLFKTKGVGQRFMSAALNAPVAVMESAGEGGAWGIALLAAYLALASGETLEAFLDKKVFIGNAGTSVAPDAKDAEGFAVFIKRYEKGLAVERSAVENIN